MLLSIFLTLFLTVVGVEGGATSCVRLGPSGLYCGSSIPSTLSSFVSDQDSESLLTEVCSRLLLVASSLSEEVRAGGAKRRLGGGLGGGRSLKITTFRSSICSQTRSSPPSSPAHRRISLVLFNLSWIQMNLSTWTPTRKSLLLSLDLLSSLPAHHLPSLWFPPHLMRSRLSESPIYPLTTSFTLSTYPTAALPTLPSL